MCTQSEILIRFVKGELWHTYFVLLFVQVQYSSELEYLQM